MVSAEPSVVQAGKTTKVFVKADPGKYFFEPPAPPGQDYLNENWMRCKFGFLGTMPAVYINRTTIICVTPAVHDPKDIPLDGVSVDLTLAMNGQDYTTNENEIQIKFIGTDKDNEMIPMIYIIVFVSTILFILLFAAITVFCFGLKKMYMAKSQHSEASAQRDSMRANAAAARPQIEDEPFGQANASPAAGNISPKDV